MPEGGPSRCGIGIRLRRERHIPAHEHPKAQLIYAIEGTMTVITREGRWVLLPTRAVWVPARTRHSILVRSVLRMRTLFFDKTVTASVNGCAVVEVSTLLRELILSMLKEPRAYPRTGRGSHLAALIQDELNFVHTLPLHLPWPKEPRLRKVCEAMQRKPSLHGDHRILGRRGLDEQPNAVTAVHKGTQHDLQGMENPTPSS